MAYKLSNIKSNVVIIDGSALAFLHGNKSYYKESLKDHIRSICSANNAQYYCLLMERSKENFRNKVAVSKGYKEHRIAHKEKHKDYLPYLDEVLHYLRNNMNTTTYVNIENDDALCILSYKYSNLILVGNDSDLLAIPGRHYNLKSHVKTKVSLPGEISFDGKKLYATGFYNVYSKIIKGSQKENYAGVLGCGPKKAYQTLANLKTEEEMAQASLNLFVEIYGKVNGLERFKEGFQLCWLIHENKTFKDPLVHHINNL